MVSERDQLVARLDSLARDALANEPLAGLSVAVIRGADTLLLAGYGYADLSHRVPVTPETTFRLIGSSTTAVAVGLLQQAEAGHLRTTDDAARLLPDFPWQGRRVTIRQLMDATSGLPDFHYLGDPHRAQQAVPKALDEVTALFAGRPFTHEPGERWQWTISGFHLAGVLLERLSGQRWADYLRHHIAARAGLASVVHCGDREIVPGLARGHVATGEGFLLDRPESATMYAFDATVCGTARDAASFARALRDGRLLQPESWRVMTTPEGAAATFDSIVAEGFGVTVRREEGHSWVGGRGNLMGYSSSVMDYPQHDLTIAVLTNTSGGASRLARRLARAVLGLSPLPPLTARPVAAPQQRLPLPAADRARYMGTYRLTLLDAEGPYAHWVRTFRVFDENGRLTIQALGDAPDPLLYQGDHAFAVASDPAARYVFTVAGDRASALNVQWSPEDRASGPRIGDGDARTWTATPR